MGHVAGSWPKRASARDPASEKQEVPGVVVEPAFSCTPARPRPEPGCRPTGPWRRTAWRARCSRPCGFFERGEGIRHRQHRSFFDVALDPVHQTAVIFASGVGRRSLSQNRTHHGADALVIGLDERLWFQVTPAPGLAAAFSAACAGSAARSSRRTVSTPSAKLCRPPFSCSPSVRIPPILRPQGLDPLWRLQFRGSG